ncbi:hypothetical protein Dimus_030183, partial [Dionaea muscipula]
EAPTSIHSLKKQVQRIIVVCRGPSYAANNQVQPMCAEQMAASREHNLTQLRKNATANLQLMHPTNSSPQQPIKIHHYAAHR